MRVRKTLILLGVVLLACAPAALSYEGDRNHIHLGLDYSHPFGDPDTEFDSGDVELELDDDVGFYADYERRLSDLIGLKFGILVNDYELEVTSGSNEAFLGWVRHRTWSANLLFHPIERDLIDFYVGAGVAYVNYDDISVPSSLRSEVNDSRINVESDRTWNVEVGVDIYFHEDCNWGLNLDLRYMDSGIPLKHAPEMEVDPISLGVGASVRW